MLEPTLITQRSTRLPQVVALVTTCTEMARTVILQAGKQSIQIFTAHLLQHTGDRFLEIIPDAHGETLSLQESSVPALIEAFQILNHEGTPDRVSVPEYLKLMLTLSTCNAWSALEALTSSLVPQRLTASGWQNTQAISVQVLKSSLEIMTLFLPQLKTSLTKNIVSAAKALPIDL